MTREKLKAQVTKGRALSDIAKEFGYDSVTSLHIIAQFLQVELSVEDAAPAVPKAVLRDIQKAGID